MGIIGDRSQRVCSLQPVHPTASSSHIISSRFTSHHITSLRIADHPVHRRRHRGLQGLREAHHTEGDELLRMQVRR